jgi:hypothetical protein
MISKILRPFFNKIDSEYSESPFSGFIIIIPVDCGEGCVWVCGGMGDWIRKSGHVFGFDHKKKVWGLRCQTAGEHPHTDVFPPLL